MENKNKQDLWERVDFVSADISILTDIFELLHINLSDLYSGNEPMSGYTRQQLGYFLSLLGVLNDKLHDVHKRLETALNE